MLIEQFVLYRLYRTIKCYQLSADCLYYGVAVSISAQVN